MSLDNLTPAEFTKWFQLGQSVRRMMGKGAEKYSYNGVVLPKLPEWDKETYPYAYISWSVGMQVYYLRCFASEMVLTKNGESMITPTDESVAYQAFYTRKNGSKWIDSAEGEWDGGNTFSLPDWTNADILNEDGSVFLKATEPVPVYE